MNTEKKKTGKVKKIVLGVGVLLVLFIIICCMAGGGDDSEETVGNVNSAGSAEEVKEIVEEYCGMIKGFDLDNTGKYLASEPDYWVDMNENVLNTFMDIFKDGVSNLEYTIEDIKVDEEQEIFSWANVSVRFRFLDYSEVMSNSLELIEKEYEADAISSDVSDEEIYNRLYEIFAEEQKSADDAWNEILIDFTLAKNRNKPNPAWYIDSIPEDISIILTCNTESSFEKYGKESNESSMTPKEYIFSGTEEDYLTYIYVKGTEVITASRYDFIGESTDLVDITFMSYAEDYIDDGIGDLIYGGDAGDRELEVRRSGFNDDSCSVSVSDWEYDNLNEPIIVTFSSDMSSIDVTATWKAGVLNQQAIFNGHYELQGTYTVDEMSRFWVDGRKNYEDIIDFDGTIETSNADLDETEAFDIWTLAGEYEGEDVIPPSNMSINIYSSPEGDIVGNYMITILDSGIEYSGELRRDADKSFSLVSNEEVSATIEVVDETSSAVVIHYSEDGFECNYRMYEAYPMP